MVRQIRERIAEAFRTCPLSAISRRIQLASEIVAHSVAVTTCDLTGSPVRPFWAYVREVSPNGSESAPVSVPMVRRWCAVTRNIAPDPKAEGDISGRHSDGSTGSSGRA